MKICLIDPLQGGHHDSYLELYLVALVQLGFGVSVFSPAPEKIRDLIDREPLLKHADVRVEHLSFSPASVPLFNKVVRAVATLKLWKNTAIVLRRIETGGWRFDLVFFLWLDVYLAPFLSHRLIDAVFPYPWVGLYFHPTHLRRKTVSAWLDRGVLRPDRPVAAKHCKAVALLDEGVEARLAERFPDKAVVSLPDVTNTELDDPKGSGSSPLIQSGSAKRTVISILGSLHRRKGLLKLIQISRLCDERFFFLVAGKVGTDYTQEEAESIRSWCNGQKNVRCCLRWIDDEREFNSLIAASDVVWAAYDDFFHSSNIVSKAAFFDKAVIVNPGYCSEERVNEFKIGICVAADDVAESARRIDSLLKDDTLSWIKRNGEFARYRAVHNGLELRRKLLKLVSHHAVDA
jgi:glycosyltransferase involved in cell wall biosynthesis